MITLHCLHSITTKKRKDDDNKGLETKEFSEAWNRVYGSDGSFIGEEPSSFAMLCFGDMRANNVEGILEIGAGHGRDTVFFASKGLSVDALDYYSITAIEILCEMAQEKN